MRKLAGLAAVFWLAAGGAAWAQAPTAKTQSGVVTGEATERANIFRAVPYAAAPVGALRWRPPQPPKSWPGTRDATKNGPSCPQPMNADGSPNAFGGANGPVSEDCLQLYVFAPRISKEGTVRKAPVMVWIHGGGHRVGAGWVYDGQNFARDGVVLVSVNYRLGALGYLAHPALTKAAGAEPTGNFGLMDQIAALKWVQRNIAAFGGDPQNVTVFGESAGGASVLALLATPGARGLFKGAIVQSGGGWSPPRSLATMETAGAEALAKAGAPANATAAQLREIPFEKLVPLAGDYGPFQDGRLMTLSPAQAFGRGRAIDVPLVVGWNSGEDAVAFGGLLGPGEQLRTDDERDRFTDRVFGAPARWIAGRAATGRPSYLYHFSYIGSRFRPSGMTRAAHAAEIQYVFEYWGRRTPMSAVSDEDRAMATRMHGCWVDFARTGRPCAEWPAYDAETDRLLEFGSPGGVREGFRKPQLDAQGREAKLAR
ncbi:MAG: carboxylesterase family protein [Phenylobacterium sp.]|uniref:carboxylesterase/lipase family protein n=1 Tax=Phenylobacterium sp. TaxID=1871053 RepID=UPI001A475946|nr:carboxylesterase family protein [Phenylobacterium sp.]MBL8555223.1 carboxylesterase family protein [Phenylobacterium sp.]